MKANRQRMPPNPYQPAPRQERRSSPSSRRVKKTRDRNGPEPVERVAIAALGFTHDRQFEISHEGIVLIDQHHIDFDALRTL